MTKVEHSLISFGRGYPDLPLEYPASAKSNPGFENDGDESPALPGHGEAGEGCGELRGMICQDCGELFYTERSCLRRECPNCFEGWAGREARVASWRMWTGAKLVARTGGHPRRLRSESSMTWEEYLRSEAADPLRGWDWRECRVVHIMISIPNNGQPIELSRAEAREVAKRHGLSGGLMVYHPFRQNQDGSYVLDDAIHYHVIALVHGSVREGGIPEDGSIVFKHLKDPEYDDYRGLRGPRSIRRVLLYLLSHAGIIRGRHALTWWGTLSYTSLPDLILEEKYPEAYANMHESRTPCPRCGSFNTEPLVNLAQEIYDHGPDWHSREPIHHCRWKRSTSSGVSW